MILLMKSNLGDNFTAVACFSCLCSAQCKEPALLFCRPFVQSHEGISSFCFRWVRVRSVIQHVIWILDVTRNTWLGHFYWCRNLCCLSQNIQSIYWSPLQGLGTDDRALIRIMVSRSEIDLFNIRKEFKETHDASLHEFIQVETMIVSLSLCLLTPLLGMLCSHVTCVSVEVWFNCFGPAVCRACSAHPFSVAAVRWWGTVIYSSLRWTMGLWPQHSCLGISLLHASSISALWLADRCRDRKFLKAVL